MTITFRKAVEADIPAVVALLVDDALGQTRESLDLSDYVAAFRAMEQEPHNYLLVGEIEGRIVATYQLALISGVSLKGARRAQVEAVRIAADLRSQGLGRALMADAETRAREQGARLMQLTSNKARDRTHAFYLREGYEPSHIGFKKPL